MDCIISDEDFIRGTLRIQSIADDLSYILNESSKIIENSIYIESMTPVEKKEFEQLYRKMNKFAKKIKGVASDLTKDTAAFLADIEETDEYLYIGRADGKWKKRKKQPKQ